MAYELSELLTPERIVGISTEHGFRPDITEQFLMDYTIWTKFVMDSTSI